MENIIPILIAVIAAAVLIVVIMLIASFKRKNIKSDSSENSVNSKLQRKGKTAIIKELEKKLSHDPHNVIALETLGEIYYKEGNWEKVYNIYKTLFDISSAHVEINVAKTTRRLGVGALNLGKLEDSLNYLMLSLKKEPEDFETNLNLGKALMQKNAFDKAAICLRKAKIIEPENSEITIALANCLFKSQKYKEALPYLKKALDEHPDNKEMLFNMAVAMSECGLGDKALKIFVHLRPDPLFGAQSCLEAGKMHERQKNAAAALQDYEIGMKLENVPEPVMIQIKYRCAQCYIAQNNIQKGLVILKQIQSMHQNYKDVESLISRYQELASNQNLQTYLMSGTSEFVALCRKLISTFFKQAYVKVEDVSVASESIEILCSIESNKWEAKELFRFYRNSTVIGDIYIREFHSRMRDLKCDNGYCVTMSTFSESAHKYAEGRPIDLIEKDQLGKLLKQVSIFN